MHPFVLKQLKSLHNKLDRKIYPEKYIEPANENLPYHSLSPISNADVKHYTKAMKWALDNRKKESINNIALTGPYGSGKSSILQTFKEENQNPEYQFLEISLATFKEELEEEETSADGDDAGNGDNVKTKKLKKNEDILRLIELSILQQIFYHEEDQQIPDSRFKKIRSFKKKSLRLITLGTMLAVIFGINLFFPKKIESILQLEFLPLAGKILHWLSLIIFTISMAIVIYRSIRLVYGLKVSKLKFQEAEIEIDKDISKSILNNHLDEILYFFEVTKYSVVFIEDLDRFRQAEIFTKLRELNLLINKSKKVEQDVVFIYAVRDEIFKDKDRTKFFDFIIPVIPVINSSNSSDKLIKLVEDNKYAISGDLIDDVSLFIDDMRLLYNITNEYHIYSLLLDKALNQDKLLAMVVYKNIFPDDFVLLNDGDGQLYKLIRKRSEFVSTAVKEMETEIKEIKTEITEIQATELKNGDELRSLYISKWVNKTDGFRYFDFNGTSVTMDEAAKKDNFDYFKTGKFAYQYLYHQYSNSYTPQNVTSDFKFPALEKEVDAEDSYQTRLERIEAKEYDAIENLKKEIQRLENKKNITRHAKLKELLSESKPKITIGKESRQDQLLGILLTSGYIDEDYLDYISLFYEGNISKADRAFLLNVKSQTGSDFEFGLTKIDNLIQKIRQADFQYYYILNYDLLDHLLISGKHATQTASFLSQLSDKPEITITFIDGFISKGKNIDSFVKVLSEKWVGFWKYISEKSLFPEEKIHGYYQLIVQNATTESLKNQAKNSDLINRFENDDDFFSLSPDHELLQNVIGFFNLKFKHIALDKTDQIMSDFVYQGKFYEINPAMIAEVIKYAGHFDQQAFDQTNYSLVLNSNVESLISYVNASINAYLENVYFQLPNNKSENEKEYISLLIHKDISRVNIEKLISQVDTKIFDLDDMSNESADDLLFEKSKVQPTWNNVAYYHYRHEDSLSESVTTFLNYLENAAALGNEPLDSEHLFGDDQKLMEFLIKVILMENLSDDSFDLLSPPFPNNFMVADLREVTEESMKIMIAGSHILSSAENFSELKEHFSSLRMLFLEMSVLDVVANQEEYHLESSELGFIMRSSAFDKEQKLQIINGSEQELILKSSALLKEIATYIVANFPFPVNKTILIGALQQTISINDRVKLFNMHYNKFIKSDIPVIFKTFPWQYQDIGRLTYSPTIEETIENRFLAKNLLEMEFIANIKDEKNKIRLINFKKAK